MPVPTKRDGEGLREARLRDVQDVARSRLQGARNDWSDLGHGTLDGRGGHQNRRFNGLSAAPARHARRRARAAVMAGLLVTGAWFDDDQRGDAGSAERQQGNKHGEEDPAHRLILALEARRARRPLHAEPKCAYLKQRLVQSTTFTVTLHSWCRDKQEEGEERNYSSRKSISSSLLPFSCFS
jgi:hypothetical protein